MTTAAMRSPRTRIIGRPCYWLSVRHSLRTEAAGALTLYGLYELARGLVVEGSLRVVWCEATRVSTELGT